MADTPAYPVYLSPDGETTQVAATPAREVQLKHAGWRKVTQPRSTRPKQQEGSARARQRRPARKKAATEK